MGTDAQHHQHANTNGAILNHDDENEREMQRSAVVVEDLKEMQKRERVKQVLNSGGFRDELEDIVGEALSLGTRSAASVAVLQQIAELIAPLAAAQNSGVDAFFAPNAARAAAAAASSGGGGGGGAGGARLQSSSSSQRQGGGNQPVIPINDLDTKHHGSEQYSKHELQLRTKLAAVYRLVDYFGWSEGIYNHITVRLAQEHEHFLLNPFGLMYHEITASSLIKVDMQGNVIDQGSTQFGVNQAGYTLHSAIHAFRPDIKCIIHCHEKSATAVSAMRCGFLPISQEAVLVGPVSSYAYTGIANDEQEKDNIGRTLGVNNNVMLLQNHGFVACGPTIEAALLTAVQFVKACEIQISAVSAGADNLISVRDDVQQKAFATANETGGGGVTTSAEHKKYGKGELEFEAWMRLLDGNGLRTGYEYKYKLKKPTAAGATTATTTTTTGKSSRNQFSDIQYPPSATSFTSDGLSEEERLHFLRALIERRKEAERTRWINTPNNYIKTELSEIGTKTPNKLIKWVRDSFGGHGDGGGGGRASNNINDNAVQAGGGGTIGGGTSGTPIKISSSTQFAPVGTNPREMRSKREQMQQRRMQNSVSAGPETKRVNWDEADQLAEAMQRGDRVITVSAVSKGIIEKEQQHNVGSYTQEYSRNPFLHVTDEELRGYK